MALLLIEGFEGLGSTSSAPQPTNILAKRYTVTSESDMRVREGRWYGRSLEINDGGYIQTPRYEANQATTITGFCVKFLALTNFEFLTLYDNHATTPVRSVNLRLTSGGEIEIYLADTLLGSSSGLGIVADRWYHIELKVYTNISGTVDLNVDGIAAVDLASVTTRAGGLYHQRIRLSSPSSDGVIFDDFWHKNDTTLLGVKQVITNFPASAGDSDEWTPSAGDNYTCINETTVDEDTTYVESNTVGQQDLYSFPEIDERDLPNVDAVQINIDCRKTGDYNFNLPSVIKRVTQSIPDFTEITSSSYITVSHISEVDSDGDPWARDNLNNSQFGIKIG